MSRPYDSRVFLCWFLHGLATFAYNISTQNMPFVQDIDNKDSQFLQLRASLPSHAQPIQPEQESNVTKGFDLEASPQLKLPTEAYRLELMKEAADLEFNSLPPDVASTIRDWLVDSADCLINGWIWGKHSGPDGGMRAETTQVKILAWHFISVNGTMKTKQLWRQVPYPVVTACECICK
uniref:Noggin n=1 Tax=Neogobius melanostomus TaxID=47308 RepID=A0A8C6SJY7_9GOBI